MRRVLDWFKRHKGWAGMLIFTLVLLCVAYGFEVIMSNDIDYAFAIGTMGGWVWFGYLALWVIVGRKKRW